MEGITTGEYVYHSLIFLDSYFLFFVFPLINNQLRCDSNRPDHCPIKILAKLFDGKFHVRRDYPHCSLDTNQCLKT
jgi:hypothetical protein